MNVAVLFFFYYTFIFLFVKFVWPNPPVSQTRLQPIPRLKCKSELFQLKKTDKNKKAVICIILQIQIWVILNNSITIWLKVLFDAYLEYIKFYR